MQFCCKVMLYVVVRRCRCSSVSVVVHHPDIAGNDQGSQNVGEGEGEEKGGSVVFTFCTLFSLFFLHAVFFITFPQLFQPLTQTWKPVEISASAMEAPKSQEFQKIGKSHMIFPIIDSHCIVLYGSIGYLLYMFFSFRSLLITKYISVLALSSWSSVSSYSLA